MPAPSVEPQVEVRPQTSDGDHDRFAHIIRKGDHLRGYALGEEVEALCGKRWVPSRDPRNYPLCPTCKQIAEGAGASLPED